MAYNNNQYPDPYAKEQVQQQHYDDNQQPYELSQFPRYDSSVSDPYAAEKRHTRFEDPDEEYGRTSRYGGGGTDARPQSQWTIPPPPKSTGFLRIWRKDERGKQWGKVCPALSGNTKLTPTGRGIPNMLPDVLVLLLYRHLPLLINSAHHPAGM